MMARLGISAESTIGIGHFAFRPDRARARAVDRHVRAAYADSIESILAAFEAQGAIPEGKAAVISAIVRERRVSPGVIAAYADLVESVFADHGDEAAAALDALLAAAERPTADETAFVTLDDRLLGAGQGRRYLRILDDDPASPLEVAALSAGEMAESEQVARAAMSLLDEAAPELGGEVRCLVREMVLARPAPGTPSDFHGASAYLLWGGLLINGPHHRSRLAMADALAHETGHSLLFGLNLGTAMVENDPAERYSSPLRDDPRPMEGIVHATYVVARMHYCMSRLLESGQLTDQEHGEATKARTAHERAFAQGFELVDRHARFTAGGRAAFEPAIHYMRVDAA